MTRALLYIAILALAFNLPAQTLVEATKKRLTPVTSETLVEGWQTGEILSSLLRAGFINKIPIGIVLEGDSLCRTSVPGSGEGIRINALIDQIKMQDPDYTAEVRNQTLYVHPRTMKSSTLNALELQLPGFTSEPNNAQEIGITLWMWIRGVLAPGETSMFAGGIQNNTETLPAFHLSKPVSVQDVLDHVISLGQGGIWAMHEVPPEWQSNPKTKPYEILSYSGDQGSANVTKCP
jgi:hypothetical protein